MTEKCWKIRRLAALIFIVYSAVRRPHAALYMGRNSFLHWTWTKSDECREKCLAPGLLTTGWSFFSDFGPSSSPVTQSHAIGRTAKIRAKKRRREKWTVFGWPDFLANGRPVHDRLVITSQVNRSWVKLSTTLIFCQFVSVLCCDRSRLKLQQ